MLVRFATLCPSIRSNSPLPRSFAVTGSPKLAGWSVKEPDREFPRCLWSRSRKQDTSHLLGGRHRPNVVAMAQNGVFSWKMRNPGIRFSFRDARLPHSVGAAPDRTAPFLAVGWPTCFRSFGSRNTCEGVRSPNGLPPDISLLRPYSTRVQIWSLQKNSTQPETLSVSWSFTSSLER